LTIIPGKKKGDADVLQVTTQFGLLVEIDAPFSGNDNTWNVKSAGWFLGSDRRDGYVLLTSADSPEPYLARFIPKDAIARRSIPK
jgi:hypothetical protein